MGLGFGGTTMTNSDITLCQYTYTNKTDDKFDCKNSFFDSSRQTVSRKATLDVQTLSTNADAKTGVFKVSFVKLLNATNTSNGSKDYSFVKGKNDFIWAYGNVVDGIPTQHAIDERGTFNLDLTTALKTTGSNSNGSGNSLAIVQSTNFFALFVFVSAVLFSLF